MYSNSIGMYSNSIGFGAVFCCPFIAFHCPSTAFHCPSTAFHCPSTTFLAFMPLPSCLSLPPKLPRTLIAHRLSPLSSPTTSPIGQRLAGQPQVFATRQCPYPTARRCLAGQRSDLRTNHAWLGPLWQERPHSKAPVAIATVGGPAILVTSSLKRSALVETSIKAEGRAAD